MLAVCCSIPAFLMAERLGGGPPPSDILRDQIPSMKASYQQLKVQASRKKPISSHQLKEVLGSLSKEVQDSLIKSGGLGNPLSGWSSDPPSSHLFRCLSVSCADEFSSDHELRKHILERHNPLSFAISQFRQDPYYGSASLKQFLLDLAKTRQVLLPLTDNYAQTHSLSEAQRNFLCLLAQEGSPKGPSPVAHSFPEAWMQGFECVARQSSLHSQNGPSTHVGISLGEVKTKLTPLSEEEVTAALASIKDAITGLDLPWGPSSKKLQPLVRNEKTQPLVRKEILSPLLQEALSEANLLIPVEPLKFIPGALKSETKCAECKQSFRSLFFFLHFQFLEFIPFGNVAVGVTVLVLSDDFRKPLSCSIPCLLLIPLWTTPSIMNLEAFHSKLLTFFY